MIDRYAIAEFRNPGILKEHGRYLARALKALSYCEAGVVSVRFKTKSDVEWAKRVLAEAGDGVERETFEGIRLEREPVPEA